MLIGPSIADATTAVSDEAYKPAPLDVVHHVLES
jgi:hypothetical protein